MIDHESDARKVAALMAKVNPPGKILTPGTRVPHYGVIAAVGTIEGERYYWMVKGRKCLVVSMMPACVVEER